MITNVCLCIFKIKKNSYFELGRRRFDYFQCLRHIVLSLFRRFFLRFINFLDMMMIVKLLQSLHA